MKIVFIYHDRPNYFGGPIVNARRLLPELHERGHEIHCLVFILKGHSHSAAYLRSRGVHCHLQKFHRCTERSISWILKKNSKIKPDVFVANLSVAGWFASRWIRKSGVPTIACHRSDDAFHWAMVDEFVTGTQDWAVDGLVCVSDDLQQKVINLNPKHTQTCVIPSGVKILEKKSTQTGPLKLVYVGRLVQEQKRILDLVDSLAFSLRRNNDITAVLIGDGSERQAVQHRIEFHGLSDRIRILGTIPSEKIQTELSKHHVLVLLSDYEGTPGAIMDAMAAGLVPVCLDIPGGVHELIIHGYTGLFVKDRGEDFNAAISVLSKDILLRKRLSANAKSHVAMNFSLKVAADRWENFCKELIRAKRKQTHSAIMIPKRFILPPVRPGLEREDYRRKSFGLRTFKCISQLKKIYFRKCDKWRNGTF